ncbi:hypothetical protein JCM30566_19430 [Marinitoga arctica]
MEYSEVRIKDKIFSLRSNLNEFQKSILKILNIEIPKKTMELDKFKKIISTNSIIS